MSPPHETLTLSLQYRKPFAVRHNQSEKGLRVYPSDDICLVRQWQAVGNSCKSMQQWNHRHHQNSSKLTRRRSSGVGRRILWSSHLTSETLWRAPTTDKENPCQDECTGLTGISEMESSAFINTAFGIVQTKLPPAKMMLYTIGAFSSHIIVKGRL